MKDYLEAQDIKRSCDPQGPSQRETTGRVDQPGMIATLAPCERTIDDGVLDGFKDFLSLNTRLEPRTVKATMEDVKRFLVKSNYVVSYGNIEKYLQSYLGKKPATCKSQITNLRRFVRDFLHLPKRALKNYTGQALERTQANL